jgi:predicted phage tail protein
MELNLCTRVPENYQESNDLILPYGQKESQDSTGYAVYRNNPFVGLTGNFSVVEFVEGATVEHIVMRACVNENWLADYMVVKIGDRVVPRNMWGKVRLKKNCPITLLVTPQGDGGSILKTLAMIAVVVVVSYFTMGAGGAAFAGMFGGVGSVTALVAGAVAVAAASMVASLALNAIFPPPSASMPELGQQSAEADVFSWNSTSNTNQQYQPVPRVYGRIKMAPTYAARPYVASLGDKQYLYLLFDFGYGPLDLEELRIGENPLDTYQNVEYKIHPSFKKGDALTIYNKDVYQDGLAQKLLYNGWRVVTSAPNCTLFVLDFNFPQGLAVVNQENGDLQSAEVSLNIQYRLAGTTTWIPYWQAPHTIDGVGTDAPVSYSYEAYWLATGGEYGENTDGGNSGGGDFAKSPRGANYEVFTALPEPSAYPNGYRITLARYEQQWDNSGGYWTETYYVDYVNELNPVDNLIERKLSIRNTTQKPFTTSLSLTLPVGEYEFQVARLSADSDDRYTQDDVYISSIRSVKESSPIAPENPHTIVEMRILANDQLNGVVSNFTAIATSRLRAWNGSSFDETPTRNPAWAYLDVLMGTAAVTKATADRVDLAAIKEWADWCDLPDTNDPTVPRNQCDIVISGETTAWQVLKLLSSIGDATPALRSGKYSISIDRPRSYPVQLFTPRNSSGFRSQLAYFRQPHALRVQYIDPLQEWQGREILVYDDGYNENNATEFDSLDLVGVTSYSQAYRIGRKALAQGQLRRETFSITTGVENILATRGDLVRISHDVPKIGSGWARIKRISGDVITFDDDIFNAETGHYLRVRVSDTSQVDLAIVDQPNLDQLKVAGDVYRLSEGMLAVYGQIEKVTMDCLVKSITPSGDLAASIELVSYAPGIYTAESAPIPDYDPLISTINDRRPGPIVNLRASELGTVVNRYHYISIGLSWTRPGGVMPIGYAIFELQKNIWTQIATTKALTYFAYKDVKVVADTGEGIDLIGKPRTFAVVAIGPGGSRIQPSVAPQVTIMPKGDTVKPGKPLELDLDIHSNSHIYIDWKHPNSNDISHYYVRYSPEFNASSIANSTVIADRIAYPSNSVTVPSRVGTYFVKTVDTMGNVSQEAAVVITPTEILTNSNLVETIGTGSFDGQKIGTVVRDGALHLEPGGQPGERVGYYYFEKAMTFGDIYAVTLASKISVEGFSSGPIDAIETYFDVKLEVRSATGKEYLDAWDVLTTIVPNIAYHSYTATDWRRLYAGEYTGEAFQFRLVLTSRDPNVGVRVTQAEVICTVPTRMEGDHDITCPPTGLRIDFNPAFQQTVAVQINQTNLTSFDSHLITNKSATGFDIIFTNNGTPVTRQFDWVAKGYGYRSTTIPSRSI